jgi:hypothetical protein
VPSMQFPFLILCFRFLGSISHANTRAGYGWLGTYSSPPNSIARITRCGPLEGAVATLEQPCPCGTFRLGRPGSATTPSRLAMQEPNRLW